MGQLEFDEREAAGLEAVYLGHDAVRRRALAREGLAARAGERVLDIGCGPGFYCVELAEEVGPDGAVVGVDSSEAMLALARRRCEPHPNIQLLTGDALSVPVEDGTFDGAVCTQVLEYVADVGAALAEMHRALRPGGRLVVWDIDWATVSLNSDDPGRMRRVLDAWDEHLVHRSLPRTLAPLLRAAGFGEVQMEAFAFATASLDPGTYAAGMLPFVAQFVPGRNGLGEADAQAWLDELRDLDRRGEFYFTSTQFRFAAAKPL